MSMERLRTTMATANDTDKLSASDMAALTRDAQDPAKCVEMMQVIERRLQDHNARNHRQIFKSLQLLDSLLLAGIPGATKFARAQLIPTLESLQSLYFEDEEAPDAAERIRAMSKKISLTLAESFSQLSEITRQDTVKTQQAQQPVSTSARPPPVLPLPKLPVRTWTDLSGSFKVDARFLSVSGNMVTLERPTGDQMGIMMDKMSSADLDYILGLQQQGIDVRKPNTISKMPSSGKLTATVAEKPPVPPPTIPNAEQDRSSTTTAAKSTLPPGFIIPATALKIDLTPSGKLGSGTSGFVRRATYAGNSVAVKIISVKHLTKQQREAVIKEAEIMSRIVHPNAVRLFGVMIEEGLGLGLVMELLPLGCLKSYIESSPIPSLAQRIRIARDVSHAMAYLHDTLNMVHRDLKALNVLLDDSGVFLRAKVCDFGFAHVKSLGMESTFWNGASSSSSANNKEFSGGAIRGLKMQAAISMGSMTVNGGMGTPLWMAPELFDMNALISKPGDVYAFTIVMTEIFSWSGPYCIAYEAIIPIMQNVIALVQSGRRPELALSADVPQPIRSLIESGWDQNPEKRPTFREMTRVLEKAKSDADYASIYANNIPLPAQISVGGTRMDMYGGNGPVMMNGSGPHLAVSPLVGSQPLDNMMGLQRSLPPQSSPQSSSTPMLNNNSYNYFGGNTQQQKYLYNPSSQLPAPVAQQSRATSQSGSIPTLLQLQNQNMQQTGLRPPSSSDMFRPHSLPNPELQLGSKHAMFWDADETAKWLDMMGEKTAGEKVKEQKINGAVLLAMDEKALGERLGVELTRQRRLSTILDDYRLG